MFVKIITTKKYRQLLEATDRLSAELAALQSQHENLHRLHNAAWARKNRQINDCEDQIEALTKELNRYKSECNKLRKKISRTDKEDKA